jgi:hypothetical protein
MGRLESYFKIKEQNASDGSSLDHLNAYFDLICQENESLSRFLLQ